MSLEPSLLHLERHFQKMAQGGSSEHFPRPIDYWSHYTGTLAVLKEQYYPHINVGLAVHSGSTPGIYTDHGGAHFDEVVRYAGKILDVERNPDAGILSPYELFLLLMGIRLHDVGNVYGRDGHEKKALAIYKSSAAIASRDRFETLTISKIAEVHGGKTSAGNKDTISQLEETDNLGSTSFRPRMIAALVRWADEICEHRNRVSQNLIREGQIPAANLIFHLYADSIKSSIVNRQAKTIELQYFVHRDHLVRPYQGALNKGGDPKPKYLLDEIVDRLGKLNTERVYCNRFLVPQLQTDRVAATISIVDGDDSQELLDKRTIDIRPHGYPSDDNSWRSQLHDFTGKILQRKYVKKKGGSRGR